LQFFQSIHIFTQYIIQLNTNLNKERTLIYENDPLVNLLELANEPIKKLPFETSAENMSVWLFNRIQRETKLPIIKIELAETKSSNVIYEKN
jgi:hypothetical protein